MHTKTAICKRDGRMERRSTAASCTVENGAKRYKRAWHDLAAGWEMVTFLQRQVHHPFHL
jgi:hypothetical protein